jgi:histidine triad (HIT) family protein
LNCIFCDIISKKREGHFIYEDEHHVAFLDKYPIDKGHVLVVPKIAHAIMKTTGAVAFSVAQNNGREAKQIIPHVHVHIIPRYPDVGAIWTKRTIPSSEELDVLSVKIKSSF